jgi:hypothetical protein
MNTLVYLASSTATKEKSFISLTPGRHQLVGSGHLSAVQWPSFSGELFLQQSFGKKHNILKLQIIPNFQAP